MDVFERDATEVMSRQHTHARAEDRPHGGASSSSALIVWAGVRARRRGHASGDGRVVPSRQLQVLQSLDGGVVEQILVHEGDKVEAGQVLLMIDPTRATSGGGRQRGAGLRARRRASRACARSRKAPPSCRPRPSNDQERAHRRGRAQALRLARDRAADAGLHRQAAAVAARAGAGRDAGQAHRRPARAGAVDAGAQPDPAAAGHRRGVGGGHPAPGARRLQEQGRPRPGGAQIGRVQASIQESTRKIQETELAFRNEAGPRPGRGRRQAQRAQPGRARPGRQGATRRR